MREDKKWIDLTKNVQMPPWGIVRRIDASQLRSGHGLHGGGLPPGGQPRSVPVQDDRLRPDVDAHRRRRCRRAIRSTTRCASPRTRTARAWSSPARATASSIRRDDGKTWTQFKDKLPAAPVNWIEVPKNAAEVAVATYGRGLWILRDVWQLEQGDQLDQQAELKLYKPRPGIRRGEQRQRGVRVLARGGADDRRSRWRFWAPTAPCSRTSQVQGARRHEQARRGTCCWPRRTSPCCDRSRPTIRTSGTRAAGRTTSGRSRTGASGRSAGSRAPRPASTRCA